MPRDSVLVRIDPGTANRSGGDAPDAPWGWQHSLGRRPLGRRTARVQTTDAREGDRGRLGRRDVASADGAGGRRG